MEAYSVEDDGDGITYNVYVYNVQPGVVIDYATGNSKLLEDDGDKQEANKQEESKPIVEIRGNSNSKIYHCKGQAAYEDMANSKYLVIFENEEDAISEGYRKAKK